MTGYHWITVARIIVAIEGIAGMALNVVLIFNLARSCINRSARLYYYSCIVTAILSFYTAFGIFITIDLATVIDGKLVGIFYGPLLFYFPEWVNNAIGIAFFAQVHTMWQVVPAPTILQWLFLNKNHKSNFEKMVMAYSVPVVFQILAWVMVPALVPSHDLRNEIAASAQRSQGTNLSDFHVFGIRILDANRIDGFDLIMFDVAPSFTVCYTLFWVGAYKIRSKLASLGTLISKRTRQLQSQFFLTQIAQVLLPLLLTSIPFGVFCVAALLGQELHNFPVLLAIMLWPMPLITALLYLGFVRKSARRSPQQSKVSISLTKRSIDQGKRSINNTSSVI